jgi:hypothetical protein
MNINAEELNLGVWRVTIQRVDSNHPFVWVRRAKDKQEALDRAKDAFYHWEKHNG